MLCANTRKYSTINRDIIFNLLAVSSILIDRLLPVMVVIIEVLAQGWTRTERDECVGATAGAFKEGGAINGYLYGGSRH